MAWCRMDDRRALHKKLRAAGFEARGLDEAAIELSSMEGTDGVVSLDMLELLAGAHKGATVARTLRLAEKLVEVGRWRPCEGGWVIHDYGDYNPLADEVRERRETRARAGAIGGQRSGVARRSKSEANASACASANAEANDQAKTNPVPSRPVPRKTLAPAAPTPRRRDLLAEAVAEVCGIDLGQITPSARGPFNRAVAELRGLDASPDGVRSRARAYRRRFEHAALTPTALAKHWASLGTSGDGVVVVPHCDACGRRHGVGACTLDAEEA